MEILYVIIATLIVLIMLTILDIVDVIVTMYREKNIVKRNNVVNDIFKDI